MKLKHFKLVIIFVASTTLLNKANASEKIKPYFEQSSISPNLIDNPFSPESSEYKNEINYIINLQKNINIDELEKAFNERHLNVEMLIENILTDVSRENSPKLFKLLDKVNKTSKNINQNFKEYWDIKRPYLTNNNVKALIASHTNPSYPSGHTCGSYVLAYVLSLLYPQYKQNFLDKAEQISQHRVLVGMHFPQDIKGGKQLSLLIMGALLQNKNFQKDLKKAHSEINQKILKNAEKN